MDQFLFLRKEANIVKNANKEKYTTTEWRMWYLYTFRELSKCFVRRRGCVRPWVLQERKRASASPLEYSRAQFSPRISRADRCHNGWIHKRAKSKKSLRSANALAV